jgi:hypothetical protein
MKINEDCQSRDGSARGNPSPMQDKGPLLAFTQGIGKAIPQPHGRLGFGQLVPSLDVLGGNGANFVGVSAARCATSEMFG